MSLKWRPTASMETLKSRARCMTLIRHFFFERGVLEVETPAMSQATVTDVHLHPFTTHFVGPGFAKGLPLYLMTSPEFHMKRLLAAGSGAIFQICKAFRNEEAGRHHNPEFSILEWYRPGFNHHDLMDEMNALLCIVLDVSNTTRITYQNAFLSTLGICPLEGDIKALKITAATLGLSEIAENENDKDTLLQLLFSQGVEPKIGLECPVFVYDFPASQAALARVCKKDPRVASRFEVYFQGIELANGFHELDDPDEQRARFEDENQKRIKSGLKAQPIDFHLIEALKYGLPNCAGVAIGIDRLIMLSLKKTAIEDVIAFSVERA